MARVDGFPGCCSVSVLSHLNYTTVIDHNGSTTQLDRGTGRFVSIIGDHQKAAYDKLCAKYTLESQSNPFMGNHGRKLIVCVFKIAKQVGAKGKK